MSDPIEDYIKEWIATYDKVSGTTHQTAAFTEPARLQITQAIIGPYVYWLERHDAEYMEGSDPDFVPASEYKGGEASPQATLSTPQPSPSKVKVSIHGSRENTMAAKEDLKKDWHLRWSGSPGYVWQGEIESKNLVAFKKWCDERKLEVHRD